MSLRRHILAAWHDWAAKNKKRTDEDRDVEQLLHFIEEWDQDYNMRLADFINGGDEAVEVHVAGTTDLLSAALMNGLPPLPKGSRFRVDYYNKKKQKLLCPMGRLTLSKRDKKFFDEFVGDDFDGWIEEFKVRAEQIAGKKLAWEVTVK
jgi:hypothetical protein